MRLRLRIERNALPPTQALWPVKDTKTTIAQLLQAVNDVFPLEADTWGLEDYSVSVGGYDCLHWYELRAACKDEDEVVIKPLQYVDVRSRTLTGRDQISSDGRHLVDGVPFGKPQLKAPVRPEIRIPPRKKRRLNVLEDRHGDEQNEEGATLMLTENGEVDNEEDEDDEEEDDDFHDDDAASETSSSSNGSEDSIDAGSEDDTSESDAGSDSDSDSDDDETWEGIPSSNPPTPLRKTGRSPMTNRSAKSTQDKQSKIQAELDRIQRELARMDAADAREEERKQDKEDKKRKRQPEDVAIPAIEPISNKKAKHTPEATRQSAAETEQTASISGIPFQGSSETKKRNSRRKNVKKLRHLIRTGILPEDATLASLQRLEGGPTGGLETTAMVDDATNTNTTGSRERTLRSSSKKVKEVASDVELETQRQKLLSDIASGGVDVTSEPAKKRKRKSKSDSPAVTEKSTHLEENDEPPSEEETPKAPPVTMDVASPSLNEATNTVPDESLEMPAPSTTPRSRLNLDASRRLVFGSLGVRTPKTQEEKDQLQKKLADRASRKVNPAPLDASEVNAALAENIETQDQAPNDEDDPDEDWRSKINLTAVECCDENVTLSTPPFPFHQRWDPQYRKQKAKKRVNGTYMESSGQKRKRGRQSQDFVESYDKYNLNGDGDALDYDDADNEDEDEYWEDGALLNGANEYEDEESEQDANRFPAMPKDIAALPILEEPNANQGDFITFNILACDASTNWQPKEIQRLAQILAVSKNGDCWMQFSPKDIKHKVFDENGERVYRKFEMPGEDDEEDEDDGTRTLPWKEMGVVRLVQRPEEVTKSLNLAAL